MAYFEAKIDWERQRKAGTENFSTFIFLQIFLEKLWSIRLCWI